MKINFNNITIYVKDNYELMSKKAAQMVVAQVNLKPTSVLGLATGSTPEGMYKEIVAMYEADQVDFSEVKFFNLDEYNQISPTNEQSYAYYMKKNLFSKINALEENIHIPYGMAQDIDKLCADYDLAIQNSGNIDLQILGIGNNGHIGFNEPDVHFEAGTHLVELDEDTIQANARFFNSTDEVPRTAISMGIRNIMHSKKIVLIANGTKKSQILEEMLFGPVTPNVPASILQLHNDVTIILDVESATHILKHFQ